jgi:hypothetical protein
VSTYTLALVLNDILRTLLFADVSSLANPVETVHLPPIIVLHHIIVLSAFRLPHEVHGWTEAEYVLWLQKHEDEKERLELLEKAVEDQAQGDGEDETVKLIKEVLVHARHEDEEGG